MSKGNMKSLYDVMREILQPLDVETVQAFHDVLENKLEELRNEQATNLQKDIGAS